MNAISSVESAATTSEIAAAHVEREVVLDAAHPSPLWGRAQPISFCKDWRGENPDPGRQTQVRILWSDDVLYGRFECRYRELFLFEDADARGRRDQLWERDVAEVFLQADPLRQQSYKEFEVSPNGLWIDLDISSTGATDLGSGLSRSTFVDKKQRIWAAELAIPMQALTTAFNPAVPWRVNFFRIEGANEPRTYLAWKPTMTPEADFHVPEVFGNLLFTTPPRHHGNAGALILR
jgi:hypothetical protein